jgi:hypothetical protein
VVGIVVTYFFSTEMVKLRLLRNGRKA